MADPVFDGLRYIAGYPDLIAALGADAEAGRRHYEQYGQAEGRNPFLFDPLLYGASNEDLARIVGYNAQGLSSHYITYGFSEGRATSSFDPFLYGASNLDLAQIVGYDRDALIRHYLEWGADEGRAKTGFDALLYGASNPDLARILGTDAAALTRHYLEWGADEGRATSSFDPLLYGASNADLARIVGNDPAALIRHYLEYGADEGRATTGFDPQAYAAAYPDLQPIANDPAALIRHYLEWGADEGRTPTGSPDPGAQFDAVAYLLTYPDLANAGIGVEGARQHWYSAGQAEGRVGDALYGREQSTHDLTDGVVTGAIDGAGDRDWYQVTLTQGEAARIALSGLGAGGGTLFSGVVVIHNALGQEIGFGSLAAEADSFVLFTPPASGTYYLSVRASGANTGSYTLEAQPFESLSIPLTSLNSSTVAQGQAGHFTTLVLQPATMQASYSGFQFVDIDRLQVSQGIFDLSNSQNIGRLTAQFGSASFTNVGNLAALEIFQPAVFPAASTFSVRYKDAVVAGAGTTVDLLVTSHPIGAVAIGSMTNPFGGVEVLRLNVNYVFPALTTGAVIAELQSDITRLEIGGTQGLTITQQLRASVHEVAVNLAAGNVSLNLGGAGAGITYTGSNFAGYVGANSVVLGNFSDTLTTYGGVDTITTGAGDDTISTGAGFDRIIAGANLTAADTIDGGADSATLVIGEKNYTDADFANVHNVSALEITGFFNTALGANAQAAGIRTIKATSANASVIDASAFTVALAIDATAGGADTIRTGSGDDTVSFNGNVILQLGSGFDVATGSGTLDLDVQAGVDRYEGGALTFIGDDGPVQTVLAVATSVTLGSALTDADYAFQVTASSFIKQNVGTANSIAFTGTAGSDTVQVDASDLGANLTANGAGGIDSLALSGGVATDASFAHISNVERLTHATGAALNATIGATAAAAGVNTVVLSSGNHALTVAASYGQALTVIGSGTGDWNLDASASAQAVTFSLAGASLNTSDVIIGSSSNADLLTATGGIDLRGVSGVEQITIDSPASGGGDTLRGTLILDTAPAELDGTALQRVTIVEGFFRTSLSRGFSTVDINASTATADLFLSGGHTVSSGSGNDQIKTSQIAETYTFLTTGWTVDGGAGNDRVLGNGLAQTINGGAGLDQLHGGNAADTLTGGADADLFIYARLSESNSAARDTITDFVSGVDQIDVTRIFDQAQLAGDTIAFVGNAANLAAAQALLTPLDDTFDAVYQQDTHTLWFDNGDGVLDGSDLSIVLTGVGSLVAADVMAGAAVTPDPTFYDTFIM